MHGGRVFKIAGWVLLGLSAATGLALVFGYIVMLLWNGLMPNIFGLGQIGYWQAVGLFILAHILFKGHHGPPHHRRCRPSGNTLGGKIHRHFHGCADEDAESEG